ncbi:MAG: hypothetical protein ABJM36_02730 [Algibacter sp.]|uniref:hypothetical protein n=1 Tax=Algibacter sp. TaxID=1872428 RepID=UPI00329952B5
MSTKFAACSETGGAFISIDITEGELASINNDAYCVDLEGSISIPATYTYDVYSSYDNLSGLEQSPGIPLFENASDFDQINYLLNQDVIGTDSPLGGKYTFGHIQWAIWEIIEGAGNNCTNDCDYLSCNPINQWDTDKAYNESLGLELVALAAAGEGFVPQCGDKIAIVLASTTAQSLIITIDVPEKEVEKECDTAFAIGNNNDGGANDDTTCFIEDGINRWGWTIGPLSVGEYTYDVFAGAGQCDTNKGELVGTATVNYSSDGNVNVTYDISADYEVSETHTYAGKAMYPTTKKGKTNVAPGQFTIESNLSGDIYVILHSVVCK